MIDGPITALLAQNEYEMKGTIQVGERATIFRVYSTKYQTEFAAKCYHIFNDPSILSFCETEVDILSSIIHQNIVHLFEFFKNSSFFVLILQLCKNGNLYEHIKQHGALTTSMLTNYTKQLAATIAHLHQNSVFLTNIHPKHILIDENGRIKLCDLSCAVKTDESIVSQPQSSINYFTAPESIQHDMIKPGPLDIWMLGITFYLMWTGSYPWPKRSRKSLKSSILLGMISYPHNSNANFIALLKMMLQPNPNSRIIARKLLKKRFFRHVTSSSSCGSFPSMTNASHKNSVNKPLRLNSTVLFKSITFGPKKKTRIPSTSSFSTMLTGSIESYPTFV